MLEPFGNKKDSLNFLANEIAGQKAPKWLCDMAEKCINQYEVVQLARKFLAGALDEQPKVEKKVSKVGKKQESVPDKEDS